MQLVLLKEINMNETLYTLTELISDLYTDMDGHEDECNCNVCLTMQTLQDYSFRHYQIVNDVSGN